MKGFAFLPKACCGNFCGPNINSSNYKINHRKKSKKTCLYIMALLGSFLEPGRSRRASDRDYNSSPLLKTLAIRLCFFQVIPTPPLC